MRRCRSFPAALAGVRSACAARVPSRTRRREGGMGGTGGETLTRGCRTANCTRGERNGSCLGRGAGPRCQGHISVGVAGPAEQPAAAPAVLRLDGQQRWFPSGEDKQHLPNLLGQAPALLPTLCLSSPAQPGHPYDSHHPGDTPVVTMAPMTPMMALTARAAHPGRAASSLHPRRPRMPGSPPGR